MPAYSRPARQRLSDVELAARIRAAGWPEDADKLSDGVVRLRQWRPEDAPAIVAGLQDGSAAYWIVGMPHPYGPADAVAFLARAEHERLTAEYAHLAVADVDSGRVLGAIGMNLRHDRQAGEIGYWTNPGDRGLGCAPRAVALITQWAFEELLLPRVELIIHPLNFESQCIASHNGFRREGLLRSYLEHRGLRNDYYCFARLSDDPAPAPHPSLRVPLGAAAEDSGDSGPPSSAAAADSPPTAAAVGSGSSARAEPWRRPARRPEAAPGELLLRPWRLRDAEVAQAMIASDEQIRRWCIGVPDPCTAQDERRFITESARAWLEDGTPTFAITDTGSGELLGSIGMQLLPGGDAVEQDGAVPSTATRGAAEGLAEVGYMVRQSARGRGVGAAALRAVTHWALNEGGFRVSEALIEPDNVASVRTAQRAGYASSGESRLCPGRAGQGRPHQVWCYPPEGRHGIRSD